MARAKRRASKEDTRNGVPYPKEKKPRRARTQKPREEKPKHVCPTCGQAANYIEVNTKEVSNEDLAKARNIDEPMRTATMLGKIQDVLRKSRSKEFALHETDTKEWSLCPGKENATWKPALMRRLASVIAPYALASRETWRIHPKMIPHPKKKRSRGGSM